MINLKESDCQRIQPTSFKVPKSFPNSSTRKIKNGRNNNTQNPNLCLSLKHLCLHREQGECL